MAVASPTPSFDEGSRRARFVAGLGFQLDEFQHQALDAVDAGQSVVVAAPTGAGKTVVAAYAIDRARREGAKAFYTTPLKALSNQKYGELVAEHGHEAVGLLTGDNAINGDAPIVVMTTEVLRNMIYASSPALHGLRWVVLDEVHYLQNAYRGPVWEEVIVHAPPEVDLVCLSATVSNAEELAGWIRTVRGDTTAVIEDRRPVQLHDLYLLGDRRSERLLMVPTLLDGRPNPEALSMEARASAGPTGRAANGAGPPGRRRPRSRLFTPHRSEVVELLAEQAMLPAIYFIFSRAACDDAVTQCVREAGRLTSAEERRQIRAIAEAHTAALADDDLRVLDYPAWLAGLEAGYAAHHAGLVPPMKEAVETCFASGLVKVVFATETLSLGINMPARSVVIEKLTKFSGERHQFLTPGEYTQLTGRAGRRGIDEVGYAVVLWSPWVSFDQVASLVGARTYALSSSFRPTYNMTANLVRRYRPDVAHHLINLSFAQYQTDSDVVRLETQLERTHHQAADARAAARCDRGDVAEYRDLLRAGQESPGRGPAAASEVAAALGQLKPGDVIEIPGRRAGPLAAVLSTSRRRGGQIRIRAVSADRRPVALAEDDFGNPPRPVGRVTLPVPYAPNSATFARETARRLRAARLSGEREGSRSRRRRDSPVGPAATHPVAGCPDARAHVRALERAERLERDAERLERRVKGRSESLARQFDRVLGVLERWGYVDGWALTDPGETLARLYHECDLLVAECERRGAFDGLSPPDLAAMVSVFTYEGRGGPEGRALVPAGTPMELRRRWDRAESLAGRLNRQEAAAGLPPTRLPDPGFMVVAREWAGGSDLTAVLDDEELSGGDFVRNVKQLVDLLGQVADVAGNAQTARTARRAADALFRDVVAASAVISSPPPIPHSDEEPTVG